MKKSLIALSFMAAGSLCAAPDYWSGANGMEMARVADAGNAAYSSETSLYNGYGSVAYEYSIGKTEVTVSQYLNFVNSFGSDAYADPENSRNLLLNTSLGEVVIYSGFDRNRKAVSYNGESGKYEAINNQGETPITYVSAIAGALYANWLSNGAKAGADCLTGVYDFKTYGFSRDALKNADRTVGGYMLCSLDEWIKAGYYSPELNGGEGGYYGFATRSDTSPPPPLTPMRQILPRKIMTQMREVILPMRDRIRTPRVITEPWIRKAMRPNGRTLSIPKAEVLPCRKVL